METKLIYLGFVISSNEFIRDPKNVREIREWSSPRTVFEVRRFHGLASFYRKFIRNFSSICAPILDTIKKERIYFNWKEEDEKGFRVLKEKITKQPILLLPDFGKTFHVKCDTSGVAIGTVLNQDNKHVTYLSEKMTDVCWSYFTHTYDLFFLRFFLVY
jgi:hypothetical protein